MSLLDDVSIVVTPNGYKAGTLYGVLPTYAEGSELITNGGFDTDSNWGKGTGWSINTTTKIAECDGSQSANTNLNPSVAPSIVNNQTYLLSLDVTLSAGTLSVFAFSSGVVLSKSSTGTSTLTLYFTKGAGGNLYIQGNADFIGSVDNVSIKEVTSSDMDVTRATAATRVDENGLVNYAEVLGSEVVSCGDLECAAPNDVWNTGSNTTISGGKINSNSAGDYIIASQVPSPAILPNKIYKYSITYTITSGSVRFGDSNAVWSGSTQSTSGTYTNIVTSSSSANGQIYITSPSSDFVGSVDNISVKEVTRNNVPRIDYTGGGCPHILAEPQRTNSFTYSEDFNQSSWSKIGITVTPNSLISPDGTQNAGKLVATNGASNKIIYQSISANTYTASVFAKKGEFEGLLIATGTTGAFFNLNTYAYRTHYTNAPTSYKIENYGNGWYRYSITFTQSSSDNLYIGVNDNVSTTFAITGNGTSGIYTFGAQLEAGSFPTSYIPTSGSSVTRNKDLFTRDGISSLINSTEGVLFLEAAALSDDSSLRTITIGDNSSSNAVSIRYDNPNQITLYVNSGGANQCSFAANVTTLSYNKIAIKYKENDFSAWANGVKIGTDTSGSTFSANTLNRINFDVGYSSTNPFFGKIKQLQVYKTALTDAQLTSLTS